MVKNCELCQQQGHNIISCGSLLIGEFKQKCVLKATTFNYNENIHTIKNHYLNWLRNQPKLLIKALALNLLLTTTTNNRIGVYINLISKHILIHERNRQFLNDTYNCELHTQVRNFINSQEIETQQQILSFIYSQESNPLRNTYQLVFDTFMCGRLRVDDVSVFYEKIHNIAELSECHICYEPTALTHMVTYNCNHSFCGLCTEKYITTLNTSCPLCRTHITSIKTHQIHILKGLQKALQTRV